jgi:hypothetical protein
MGLDFVPVGFRLMKEKFRSHLHMLSDPWFEFEDRSENSASDSG